jgi:hypothetical protein
MEYERTEDAQIQADFAGRVGQVLLQYENFMLKVPQDQRFEATLSIALLQTMLTQCQELLKKHRSPKSAPQGLEALVAMANRGFNEAPPLLGLTQSCILERWPSAIPVKYRDLIECIRNALSHPLHQNNEQLPRTGYTTQMGSSGLIEAFLFTQSPWVGPSGALLPQFRSRKGDRNKFDEAALKITNWARNSGVESVVLTETQDGFVPMRNGMPFVPVMRVRLEVAQLRLFVLALSDYLYEPLRQMVLAQSEQRSSV